MIHIIFLLLTSSLFGEAINTGEDPLEPVRRFDIRFQYQTGVDDQEGKTLTYTLRTDQVFDIGSNWRTAIRIDLPFQSFYCPNHCTRYSCYSATRAADSLFQALFIAPPIGNWMFGAGAKFIFPTAGDNLEIGSGKYQFLPTLGIRYDLGFWNEGAYIGTLIRYDTSFGGHSTAHPISRIYLKPFFNMNLNDGWFLNSSPEMFYGFYENNWFIPFDIMIGKMLTPKIVFSVEYEVALLKQHPSYSQQVELRFGYFF